LGTTTEEQNPPVEASVLTPQPDSLVKLESPSRPRRLTRRKEKEEEFADEDDFDSVELDIEGDSDGGFSGSEDDSGDEDAGSWSRPRRQKRAKEVDRGSGTRTKGKPRGRAGGRKPKSVNGTSAGSVTSAPNEDDELLKLTSFSPARKSGGRLRRGDSTTSSPSTTATASPAMGSKLYEKGEDTTSESGGSIRRSERKRKIQNYSELEKGGISDEDLLGDDDDDDDDDNNLSRKNGRRKLRREE